MSDYIIRRKVKKDEDITFPYKKRRNSYCVGIFSKQNSGKSHYAIELIK